MNNTEAKFILRSYRPDGDDAADPAFREALVQADRDPALRDWFQHERARDQAVRNRLNEVEPPAELLGEILAMQEVASAASRSFWQRGGRWMALAAALLLVVGGAALTAGRSGPALAYDAFPHVATAFLQRPFELDAKLANVEEATQWLQAQQTAWDIPVSDSLSSGAERGVGCRALTWRGQEVYLICFFLDDGSVAHFFMMDAGALPDAPAPAAAPQWVRRGDYTTATWTDGKRAFVLASQMDRSVMESLL
jgi:hypothetical protein